MVRGARREVKPRTPLRMEALPPDLSQVLYYVFLAAF